MNKASRQRIGNQRVHGEVILARFADVGTPATMKAPVKSFAQTHAAYEVASEKAEAARLARDNALETIGAQDAVLDAAVLVLADRMVGAGLGTRVKPLARFTKYAPSDLTELAYAEEVREVRAIVAKIAKAKPTSDVAKASAACAKAADAVDKALRALPGPQSAYVKALGARDALLLTWQKALSRLKKHAAAAWDDDPSTLKAIFSPPDAVVAPVKRRPKKAGVAPGANGAATSPAAPS